jgi:hypothetical protein
MKTWNTTIAVALLSTCAFADDATLSSSSSSGMRTFTDDMAGRFGLGVIFGEPTGVSLKYFTTDTIAIDGGLGWSFHNDTDLHLHADVLWHKFDLFPVEEGKLPLYFGVGARFKIEENDDDRFGIRFPIGISYMFEHLPMDVFFEVAPILDLAPETEGGFTAGIGCRWWF